MQTNPAAAALGRFVAGHADIDRADRIGIAFSGGADSTALLLAAEARWGAGRCRALHVDHGLQAAAALFSRHCRDFCQARGIAYAEAKIEVGIGRGQSAEEQARDARYAALARLAHDTACDIVLLAHHGDDQVESLLLALLRGAGPRGLAAMPARMRRHDTEFARPLLDCGGAELRAWLDARGIGYVHDPMNLDPAYRRSRIRHELLPVIARLEPGYRRTLARSAALCAAADTALQQRARDDLQRCAVPGGLRLDLLRTLGDARCGEVLRLWLRDQGVRFDRARTEELVKQVARTGQGAARLEMLLPRGRIVRRAALLVLDAAPPG